MKLRLRMLSYLTALILLVGLCGSSALADNIKAGDTIVITNNSTPYHLMDTTTQTGFYTFCLEKDEYFEMNTPMTVDSISKTAWAGGKNTNNGDEISYQTAWLYEHYRMGDLWTLINSNQQNATLSELQDEIWFLEGEIKDGHSLDNNEFHKYVNDNNPGNVNDFASVWVINPVTITTERECNWFGFGCHDETIITKNQSLLIYTPPTAVPEPGSLILLGTGLLGAGFLFKRKR